MTIQDNLTQIQERIRQACLRSNRSVASVTLLGVSKYANDAAVQSVMELGLKRFGESRVQQGVKRIETFPEAEWHLIGTLQRNKVRHCREFALIHSLDRWSLALEINKRAEEWGRPQDVLVQVNVSGEESKHGLRPDEVSDFVEQVKVECPFVNMRGLMMMAPFVKPEETRPYFRETRALYDALQKRFQLSWDVLSMGMTNDFEVAIEEGATLVRIGSALFAEEENNE